MPEMFFAQSVPIVTTDHEIVIWRSPLLSVLSNRGSGSSSSIVAFTVPTLKAGTVLVDIVPSADINDSANHVMVGIGGSVRVGLTDGKPRVCRLLARLRPWILRNSTRFTGVSAL
jgi:hypothetical protein